MIDLSKCPAASPLVQTVDADPGVRWSKDSVVAIEAPPDSDARPCPEPTWSRDARRTGVSGVVSPRVIAPPSGGYRMYYSQMLARPRFPAGANDYDNGSTRILSAHSQDGQVWVPEPGVRLLPQAGGAGDFRVVASEMCLIRLLRTKDEAPHYRMFYEACDGTAPNYRGVWRIAAATSASG